MQQPTRILAVLVALALSAIVADDAFARARMYHPEMGRFTQRDPHGTALAPPTAAAAMPSRNVSSPQFTQRDSPRQYTDGMNLYQYVASNPTRFVDPLGENLYAIDGTWTKWGDGSNTEEFYRRTTETKYYWRGPRAGATGIDSGGIYRGVKRQICDDYCESIQTGEEITINLVGWSRGANVAISVADSLADSGCCCCRTLYGGCADRVNPDVDFLGLFDAVSMTATPGWATEKPSNVQHFAHAMATAGQAMFPQVPVGGRWFWRHDGDPTTHADIGMNRDNNDAFDWIVSEAKKAGVNMN